MEMMTTESTSTPLYNQVEEDQYTAISWAESKVEVSGCHMLPRPANGCRIAGTVFFLGMAALGAFAITAGALARYNIRPFGQWSVKIADTLQISKSPIEFGAIGAGITLVGFGIFSVAQVQHSRKSLSNEPSSSLKERISSHKVKTAAAITCGAIALTALSIIALSLIPKTPIGAFFRTYPGVWIPAWAAASFSSLGAMALACHILRDKPSFEAEF